MIGRMGGADCVPETVDELDAYVEHMRPLMAMNEQTVEFIGFLAGRVGDQQLSARERYDRWVGIRASMGLMPEWARRMTGTYVPELLYRLWFAPSDRLKARSCAGRTPSCRARRWRWPAPAAGHSEHRSRLTDPIQAFEPTSGCRSCGPGGRVAARCVRCLSPLGAVLLVLPAVARPQSGDGYLCYQAHGQPRDDALPRPRCAAGRRPLRRPRDRSHEAATGMHAGGDRRRRHR